MKIIKIKQAPCNCNAYAFPHRANSGKCEDPGEDPGSCADCDNCSVEKDPYGTGDHWFSAMECNLNEPCPWGHDE